MRPASADDRPELTAFIKANLPLAGVPSIPNVRLHMATPKSGLYRLAMADDSDMAPPYWAYPWAGGTVLAHYLFDHPETVTDKHVVDLGTGSGLVAIVAMKCGASRVLAVDIDAKAIVAAQLNAQANNVMIETRLGDITGDSPPAVDVLLAGDIFYDEALAEHVLPFLQRCSTAGIDVLIGDPGRAPLPSGSLVRIADYSVPDFGGGIRNMAANSAVYRLS
ncbi:putative nicotinamide N-methyase [Rhizobium sp. BK650]|uniref:class I SAM-dependent methyltransferase n=1 Tax=Rhizobium sp. BK650 TaxID=2586990 RepID=UPI0016097E91|nr:50S ribosomal protein L11 methyltransferase [Rhizobium sp. BK650]MBB3657168.1 putative nicotinamide N-methyase [Rhizobium sp. BK650]